MKCFYLAILCSIIFACKPTQKLSTNSNDLLLTFGSCNKQDLENPFWDDILQLKPEAWIWGGDVVYADTYNMDKLRTDYVTQNKQNGYEQLKNEVTITGVWDDHDYGANDAGSEYPKKEESQEIFLNFLNVDKADERRKRGGVYTSKLFKNKKGSVNVIMLDTRYFRTELTPSNKPNRRYEANPYGEGTILGAKQWAWLENELNNSKADFNIILSSIQILSNDHGFERWGTFPHERDRLFKLIQISNAKGVVLLSGDRHISEFSKLKLDGLDFPLIDFTSSGLTHSYESNPGELNTLRVGNLIKTKSFGALYFNFDTNTVTMQIRGENNAVFQEIKQSY